MSALEEAKKHMAKLITGKNPQGKVFGYKKFGTIDQGVPPMDNTAFYSVVHEGTFAYSDNTACHAGLLNYWKAKPLFIVNYIGRAKEVSGLGPDEAGLWYNYLFNNSPYSKVFLTKGYKEALTEGAVISCNYPSELMVGACIHLRQPWEHPSNVRVFLEGVKRGLDPNVMFILAHGLTLQKGGVNLTLMRALGHQGMSINAMGVKGFMNFLSDDPQFHSKKTYSERCSYGGVDLMWDSKKGGQGNKKYPLYPTLEKALEKVEAKGDGGDYYNPFKKRIRNDVRNADDLPAVFEHFMTSIEEQMEGQNNV